MQIGRVFFKKPPAACVEKLKGAPPMPLARPRVICAGRAGGSVLAAARGAARQRREVTGSYHKQAQQFTYFFNRGVINSPAAQRPRQRL
jgi:hypothetical protein